MLTLISAFRDNYVYLLEAGTGRWLVDPGDPGPVEHHLQAHSLSPTAILCTHHHADHVGGVEHLARRYGLPVYGSGTRIPALTHPVQEGVLRIDGEEVEVLEIPGHTLDHVAYRWKDFLFCGDTLFSAGCGRIFEGTPDLLFNSLEKLRCLPGTTQVCCAHEYTWANLQFSRLVEPGNTWTAKRLAAVEQLRAAGKPSLPSTLEDEKHYNPFLRCSEPTVVETVRRWNPGGGDSPREIFATLRRWKDGFTPPGGTR